MTYNPGYFNIKSDKLIPVDEFVEKVLYEPNIGYYTKKIPFGSQGDFVTAPTISNLFSEIMLIDYINEGSINKFNIGLINKFQN